MSTMHADGAVNYFRVLRYAFARLLLGTHGSSMIYLEQVSGLSTFFSSLCAVCLFLIPFHWCCDQNERTRFFFIFFFCESCCYLEHVMVVKAPSRTYMHICRQCPEMSGCLKREVGWCREDWCSIWVSMSGDAKRTTLYQ